MDSHGNLYFGLMDPPAIACWNTSTEYLRQTLRIVELNRETLQFGSGMKVVRDIFGQEYLWVVTTRLPKLRAGKFDWNDINYRIQAIPISDIMRTGGCNPRVTTRFDGSIMFPDEE